MDPNVAMARPMSRDPDVMRTAHIIARAASVVRPIANRDRDGAWVTTVIRSIPTITTIVRSVSWISTIIPFTSRCTERDRSQEQRECGPFHSRLYSTLCRFRLHMINNVRFHTLSIRIRHSLHAPAFIYQLDSLPHMRSQSIIFQRV